MTDRCPRCDNQYCCGIDYAEEVKRLKQENAELLEALEAMVGFFDKDKSWKSFWAQIQSAFASLDLAKRAIEKATGKKSKERRNES